MFDELTREELWELYFMMKMGAHDVMRIDPPTYGELADLRFEIYNSYINPHEPYPVLH